MDQDTLRDEQLGFQLFSIMAALAVFVLFMEREYASEVHGRMPVIVPLAFAFVVAWKPSNVWLSLSFWAVCTWFYLFGFPRNNTNQTIVFFVGVAVLASAIIRMLETRRIRLTGADLFRTFNPVLRVSVVAVYFWTFWNKLNIDFLTPGVSCATTLTSDLIYRIGLDPNLAQSLAAPSVVMTLLVEAALPLGLLFKRTQRTTVVLGVAFHWVLGVAGFYGFSGTMLGLLMLFAYPIAGRSVAAYDAPSFIRPLKRSTLNRVALVGYLGVIVIGKYGFGLPTENLGWVCWLLLPIVVAALWWNNRSPVDNPRAVPDPNQPLWWLIAHPRPLYVVPFLVFLNGLSPWIGFKTEYSFAMYSNLRTEGGATNHLIWRKPLPLAKYQTDLVYVLEASDSIVRALGGRPIPRYVLTQVLRDAVINRHRSDVVLVLREGTAIHRIEAAERDSALMAAPSFIEQRLLNFRRIEPAAAGTCLH